MLLSTALLPLLLLSASQAGASASTSTRRTPQPRSYNTHTYYALELPESADGAAAQAAARALGVEIVEPLGELAGHWLVRRETGALTERSAIGGADPVVERYTEIRKRARALDGLAARTLGLPKFRSLEVLVPKQRTKRQWPPPPPRRRSRRQAHDSDDEQPRDETELKYIQNDIGLHDPLLPRQWHIANPTNKEWELNVTGLWKSGVTGTGVKVAIVDDGLDMAHEDLRPNYFAEGSYDFNDHDPSPAPVLSDDQHGTRCAGEIAAAPNDVCGVGVAYNAKVAGIRILSGPITNADEAAALNYKYQENDIYSCSWGPPDDGKSMEAPDGLILKAIVNGVQKGRGGKGSLFVFAAGNGGSFGDQCNFDGYTNSIFSVTVGAVDHTGRHPQYSEKCSAMMVVAPSSGSGDWIHTTDAGAGKCASNHGGTSAAAPLMAGVLALALQVRPELTWRDVQHLAVNHAVMLHEDDKSWEMTAAGRKYSYMYGYGKIDAGQFIEAARNWKLVKPQAWFASPAQTLPYTVDLTRPTVSGDTGSDGTLQDAPNGVTRRQSEESENKEENQPDAKPSSGSYITPDGVNATFEVTQQMMADSNFARLEHVTVRVWITHQRRGDISVILRSPNGVESVLASPRLWDENDGGFNGWKFMTLKHWDENPVGTWQITVKDDNHPERSGRFHRWALQLWGEVEDESDVRLWHPAEEGEVDPEETGSDPSPSPLPQKPKPTALLPSQHGGELPLSLQTTGKPQETPTGTPDTHPAPDEGVFDGIDTLRKHSSWLAGAFLIVLICALGGGTFFLIRERKRRARLHGMSTGGDSSSRGAYAPVAEEEVPLTMMERGRRAVGLGHGKRDGAGEESKELYDAFGDGPTDSEDEDDATELRYHDDFLDDEGDEEHRVQSGSGSGSGSRQDHDDAGPEDQTGDALRPGSTSPDLERVGDGGKSDSSSWQDAADDARHD